MGITKEELEKILSFEPKIECVSTISSDGKNLLTRFPKELREFLDLKKGDKIRFLVEDKEKIFLEIIRHNAKEEKERARRNR